METDILTHEELSKAGIAHAKLRGKWLELGMPCEPLTQDFLENMGSFSTAPKTLTEIVNAYFSTFPTLIRGIDDMWTTIDKLLDQINTLKAERARTVIDSRPSLGGE